MTEHSFLFNTHLIGQRSNQSHRKDGITGKLLNKVIWRNFLCLRILNPEISLHFAMALREAYDTLNNLLTDHIDSIMLSKSLVNTYRNNFHLCAKANITDLLIHFCSHVCELCILRDCIQIASKAMPKLKRWNETLKFNFFFTLLRTRFSWKTLVCWFILSFGAEVSYLHYASNFCFAKMWQSHFFLFGD